MLASVASGQALAQWQSNISDQRTRQWTQNGDVVVVSSVARYLRSGVYGVTACLDVSKVNVVDAKGKSVLAASRPDRVQYTYEVTKRADVFFVTRDSMKGSPC